MDELKNTLIEQGQPFVWFTPLGWFFHEQADSICWTRDEVLAANSLDELMEKPVDEPKLEIKEPARRGRKPKE